MVGRKSRAVPLDQLWLRHYLPPTTTIMVSFPDRLPRELLNAITDILNEEDRPALKAFATTCRSVRPYALSHLFYHLHFGRLLYSNERIDKFLEFCKRHQHIPRIYRKLTLSLGYVDNTRSAVLSIRLLANIEILKLTQLSPTNISPYLQAAFFNMPVRSLTCEDMKISNKAAFVQFIAQCLPRVVHLGLSDIGSADGVGKNAARANLISNPLNRIQTVTMTMGASPLAFDVRMLELPCMRDVTIGACCLALAYYMLTPPQFVPDSLKSPCALPV